MKEAESKDMLQKCSCGRSERSSRSASTGYAPDPGLAGHREMMKIDLKARYQHGRGGQDLERYQASLNGGTARLEAAEEDEFESDLRPAAGVGRRPRRRGGAPGRRPRPPRRS